MFFPMFTRIFIIFAILASALGYSVYQRKSFESQLAEKSESILGKMPQGVFDTLDGKTFNPHDLDSNSLIIVHFWGTWCAPCEAELPELLELVKRFEKRSDVKFLFVAVSDEKLKVQKHLKTLSIPKAEIIWLLDNKNIHRDVYGTTRVPETYVFSSNKSTLRKYVGPQEWSKPMFFEALNEFLQISARRL